MASTPGLFPFLPRVCRHWHRRPAFAFLSILSFTAILFFAFSIPVSAALLPHSKSESGQFVVYAQDAQIRNMVAHFAEEIKKHWLRVSGLNDQWRHPILIVFSESASQRSLDPVQIQVFQADAGAVKFQITIRDIQAMDSNLLIELLFQGLLLEYASRTNPPKAGQKYELPPLWLRKGLLQDFLISKGQMPASVGTSILQAKKQPTVVEVIAQEKSPPTQVEERLFRLKAYALLTTVLETACGRQALCEIANKKRSHKADINAILQSIPEFSNDPGVLEKRWMATLIRRSYQRQASLMTMADSQNTLDRLLAVEVTLEAVSPSKSLPFLRKDNGRSSESSKIEGPQALPILAKDKNSVGQLIQLTDELLNLEARANPLFQPSVAKYRSILSTLVRNPRTNVEKHLTEAEKQFVTLKKQSAEIVRYLDRYEVDKFEISDAEFSHFVKAMPSLQRFRPRGDPISQYLDAFEASY